MAENAYETAFRRAGSSELR